MRHANGRAPLIAKEEVSVGQVSFGGRRAANKLMKADLMIAGMSVIACGCGVPTSAEFFCGVKFLKIAASDNRGAFTGMDAFKIQKAVNATIISQDA